MWQFFIAILWGISFRKFIQIRLQAICQNSDQQIKRAPYCPQATVSLVAGDNGFTCGEEAARRLFALSPPLMVHNFEITVGSVRKQTCTGPEMIPSPEMIPNWT